MNLVLGTAGHIDHGKSALVKALTGVDPDRLAEEKRRGITIELGFARLSLPDGSTMGVVDVPGHERFVRQMIAGATGIDLALLCIAADDGIMPQTVEHIAVLEVLGVRQCVVALTKCDLVDADWLELVKGEVSLFLRSTAYADSPVVAVCARTGFGLEELLQTLARVSGSVKRLKQDTGVRLPVDRVFTIKGSGTVVTGTLWSGCVRPGAELELLPKGIRAKVRAVQTHGEQTDNAQPGSRVALNLSTLKTSEVHPGDFLATPGSIRPTNRADVWFTYLDTAKSGKPLESGQRVRIAHGTKEVLGRILFMNGLLKLQPNTSCLAQLRLDEPLLLSWQDRFVLRRYSPVSVAGGGMVLHCHPRRRTTTGLSEDLQLCALRDGDKDVAVDAAFSRSTCPVDARLLAVLAGVDAESTARRLAELGSAGTVRVVGQAEPPYYAKANVLQKCMAALENALLEFHAKNPTVPGVTPAALKQMIVPRSLPNMGDAAFLALLDEAHMCGRVLMAGGYVSHPKAGAGARAAEEQEAERLLAVLTAAGGAPPSLGELAAASAADTSLFHRALNLLEKQGRIRKVSRDFCFATEAVEGFKAAVVGRLEAAGSASVSDLKEAMQTSRKYAVPLLEYFDAQGLTCRSGDMRRLR
ncbi:MAG: selenocysteine-specific translation elongation factor [Coriobacteriales bacterium]|jgi:selenocysteine-specific elongation factor|nr:selenocysteine-specific translation elongation factor [Coriobacteriales bacterium]